MRILFVAMHNSIHTSRWVNQLSDQGWDVHLFPSWGGDTHVNLRNVTVHELFYRRPQNLSADVHIKGIHLPLSNFNLQLARLGVESFPRLFPWARRSYRLARLIKKLKPDIVQSLEIQHAGYLTLEAKKRMKSDFPIWIVTNWGNDIQLFGRLSAHHKTIRQVLSECDYYSCECLRDVDLALQMGFKGEVLPVLPNCGGFDLEYIAQFRQSGSTSLRRLIFVKGYQDWHGRALVALRAIALCAESLVSLGYRIAIHSASLEVKIAGELLSNETGLPVDILPSCTYEDMLRLHGSSRVHIGLAISDGIAITSLESMVMGAFPIQSCTACANEWIEDGLTGFIVPPEDPQIVADAIRRAVTDDSLVDQAEKLNSLIARERLDEAVIKPQVIEMYNKIAMARPTKRLK